MTMKICWTLKTILMKNNYFKVSKRVGRKQNVKPEEAQIPNKKPSGEIILSESATSDLKTTVIDKNHFGPDDKKTKLNIKKEEESKVNQIIDLPIAYDEEGISYVLLWEAVGIGKKSKNQYENTKIWIPKAICLISCFPYYDFFTTILIDLYYTMFHNMGNANPPKKQAFML